ncbi:Chromo domain-containing protein [Plasmodiophora brassicae]
MGSRRRAPRRRIVESSQSSACTTLPAPAAAADGRAASPVDDGDHYEVEAIVGRRVLKYPSKDPQGKGAVQFRVKWKGYSHQDNTWEPGCNLERCIELVTAFLCANDL